MAKIKSIPNLGFPSGYRSRRKEVLDSKDLNIVESPETAEFDKNSGQNSFKLREFEKKYRFIWVFSVGVALAAGFFSWRGASKYIASLALTVSRSGTQQSIDYKYDSYYALQATDDFGDTVVGWFKTPEIVRSINERINVDSSGWSFRNLSNEFNAAKISPNSVEVRYKTAGAEDAKKIAGAIGQTLNEKVDLLNSLSGQGLAFAVVAGEPVIARNSFNLLLNILGGFLVGLAFGLFVKTAKEYFSSIF